MLSILGTAVYNLKQRKQHESCFVKYPKVDNIIDYVYEGKPSKDAKDAAKPDQWEVPLLLLYIGLNENDDPLPN